MATNRWRGDAPEQSKILRLLQPNNTSQSVRVVVSVGNKTLSFDGWNGATIATQLDAQGWAELADVTISESAGDVVLTGADNVDFDVTVSISPAVEVEFTQAVEPVNQKTRLNFNDATAGTFTLTCNTEKTAAITLKTSGALNTGGIVSAIEALSSFTTGDVAATVDGADVLLEWKGNFAKSNVSVVLDATELNNGGNVVVSETQAATPATHDIWFMASDADFEFDISDGSTAVTLKTNELDADIAAKLSAAWGGKVDVYSDLDTTTPIARRFYVLDMVGFGGTTTTLTVSSISPVASPVGVAVQKIVDRTDTTPSEVFLVNRAAGDLSVSYEGSTITGWDDPDQVETDLESALQFSEWTHNDTISDAALSGGSLQSTDLWLLRFMGDGPRLAGTGPGSAADGGEDFPESTLVNSGAGSLTLLQHGGPTNAADAAIHSVYLKPNDADATLAGTYDLDFPEGLASSFTVGDAAATVQTTINTDTGLSVTVSGTGTAADPYLIDYGSDTNTRDLPTPANVALTGDGDGTATTDVAAVFGSSASAIVRVSTSADGGTYTLKNGNEGPVEFDYNESAANFKTDLEGFPTLSTAGDTAVAFNSASGEYVITYQSNLAFVKVPVLTLDVNNTTDSTQTDDTREIQQFASGAGNFADPLNWSLGVCPNSDDTVVLDSATAAIEYGLRQFGPVTINTTTNTLTATDGHDLNDGQTVQWVFGTTGPTGVSEGTDYFVINANRANGTYQISATANGAAVNITAAGTGTHYCGVIAGDVLLPASFAQAIGLARDNGDGFEEYRPRFLAIGIASTGQIAVGNGDGNGSSLLNIDTGASNGQLTVYDTGQSAIVGQPAVVWDCFSDNANLLVYAGDVGVAVYEDETSKLGSANVRDGSLVLGSVTFAGNLIAEPGTVTARRVSITGLLQIG